MFNKTKTKVNRFVIEHYGQVMFINGVLFGAAGSVGVALALSKFDSTQYLKLTQDAIQHTIKNRKALVYDLPKNPGYSILVQTIPNAK